MLKDLKLSLECVVGWASCTTEDCICMPVNVTSYLTFVHICLTHLPHPILGYSLSWGDWNNFLRACICRIKFKQECIPVGYVPPAHWLTVSHSVRLQWGHACPRRIPQGMQAPPGTHDSPVNRMTDTCKNITIPQLRLRAVMICFGRLPAEPLQLAPADALHCLISQLSFF